jgi:Protein of unknown function (DUF3558)
VPPDRMPDGGAGELTRRDDGRCAAAHRPSRVPRYGRRVRFALVLAGMAVACAACTATVVPPAPAPATGIVLVPRPRDIPVDDVDPCSLLTPAQRVALGLDGEPRNSTDDSLFLGPTRNCTVLGFGTPKVAISIAVASRNGIERYTVEGSRSDVSPIAVGGFPAVLARPRTFTDFCTVALDVAPGQLIDVQFSDGGGGQAAIPMATLCSQATSAASGVVTALLNR